MNGARGITSFHHVHTSLGSSLIIFSSFLFFRSLVKNDSLGNFDFNRQRHLDVFVFIYAIGRHQAISRPVYSYSLPEFRSSSEPNTFSMPSTLSDVVICASGPVISVLTHPGCRASTTRNSVGLQFHTHHLCQHI